MISEQEFMEIVKRYSLRISHAEINIIDGEVCEFDLTDTQIQHLRRFNNADFENFNYRAKMHIVSQVHVPLGQIPGSYEFFYSIMRLTGSFDYMILMIKQLFG